MLIVRNERQSASWMIISRDHSRGFMLNRDPRRTSDSSMLTSCIDCHHNAKPGCYRVQSEMPPVRMSKRLLSGKVGKPCTTSRQMKADSYHISAWSRWVLAEMVREMGEYNENEKAEARKLRRDGSGKKSSVRACRVRLACT